MFRFVFEFVELSLVIKDTHGCGSIVYFTQRLILFLSLLADNIRQHGNTYFRSDRCFGRLERSFERRSEARPLSVMSLWARGALSLPRYLWCFICIPGCFDARDALIAMEDMAFIMPLISLAQTSARSNPGSCKLHDLSWSPEPQYEPSQGWVTAEGKKESGEEGGWSSIIPFSLFPLLCFKIYIRCVYASTLSHEFTLIYFEVRLSLCLHLFIICPVWLKGTLCYHSSTITIINHYLLTYFGSLWHRPWPESWLEAQPPSLYVYWTWPCFHVRDMSRSDG